jgi:hypothetical protein
VSQLTSHLRGEARLRELVRLLAQDLGYRLRIDTGLGAPPHGGPHGVNVDTSALLVREAVDLVDAADTRDAHATALELGPGEQASGHVRCYILVERGGGARIMEPLGALWVNPAMGMALAHHGLTVPRLVRGTIGATLTIAGRAAAGGWWDRWISSQLAAGAVRFRNGVRTAATGVAIPDEEEQRELAYAP